MYTADIIAFSLSTFFFLTPYLSSSGGRGVIPYVSLSLTQLTSFVCMLGRLATSHTQHTPLATRAKDHIQHITHVHTAHSSD
jgi:hypothetical protein